jgi:hypothetical protein
VGRSIKSRNVSGTSADLLFTCRIFKTSKIVLVAYLRMRSAMKAVKIVFINGMENTDFTAIGKANLTQYAFA